MDGEDSLDRLHFNNDRLFYDDIHSIGAFDRNALIRQGEWLLTFDRQSTVRQLVGKALLVRRFQETRSQLAVDGDRRTYDLVTECVESLFFVHSRRYCKDLPSTNECAVP